MRKDVRREDAEGRLEPRAVPLRPSPVVASEVRLQESPLGFSSGDAVVQRHEL